MTVALVALSDPKETLRPPYNWRLCSRKSLCPVDPLAEGKTKIWGLRKDYPDAKKDSPTSGTRIKQAFGISKVMQQRPLSRSWNWIPTTSAHQPWKKHFCWRAPHLIAGETWSEQKGDSQPLAKLLALLSGSYQACASQKVPFRCIFPERLNASVQITVLRINCPLRLKSWSLRPCAQDANHYKAGTRKGLPHGTVGKHII